ncbi:MAG: pyridoxamine 5'-phosphate oxidase family protein [Candidatus Cloacimonetes bacterium]|nr:pyridoxamine 5'-phosphate oxidase family protein [Candidatus Cloacimonadota bacterium]
MSRIENPFHQGELEIQALLNESEISKRNSRVIDTEILKGALNFIEQQKYFYIGSVDSLGNLHTSMIYGKQGFIKASQTQIVLDKDMIQSSFEDIFFKNVSSNPVVGSIFIELASRRRIRINGDFDLDTMTLQVKESYPNCPKFIQKRILHVEEKSVETQFDLDDQLNEESSNVIENSDTFFVSSGSTYLGLDTSHRGGKPGFVKVINNTTLKIPDYPGNSIYNTLGNFQANPSGSILFIDFINNTILQLSGKVTLEMSSKLDETKKYKIYWIFHIKLVSKTTIGNKLSWEFLDPSPLNPIIIE